MGRESIDWLNRYACDGLKPDLVVFIHISVSESQRRLYRRQLEGLTTRQLVLDHAARESISEKTAWMDWRAVSKWNEEDWLKDREALLSRLQGMRFRAITAAQLMDSVGRVLNESGVEQQAAAAPTLQITVEDKRQA